MDIVIALILGLFVNPSEVLDAEAEWGVYQDPIINLSANVESSDFIVLGRAEKITVSPRQYTRDRVYIGSAQQECVSNAVVSIMAGHWLKGKPLASESNIVCTIECVDQKWKPVRHFYWETLCVGEWRLLFLRRGAGPQTEFGAALGCISTIPVSAPVAESICNDYKFASSTTATVLAETLVRQTEYLSDSGFLLGSTLGRNTFTSISGRNWGEDIPKSRWLNVKEDLSSFVVMIEYMASLSRVEPARDQEHTESDGVNSEHNRGVRVNPENKK